MVVQSFTVPVIISPAHCTLAVLLKVHCSAPVARQSVSEDSFPMHLKKTPSGNEWYMLNECGGTVSAAAHVQNLIIL